MCIESSQGSLQLWHLLSSQKFLCSLLRHSNIEQVWGCRGSIPDCIPVSKVKLSQGKIFFKVSCSWKRLPNMNSFKANSA
jgi:hypothetical protein